MFGVRPLAAPRKPKASAAGSSPSRCVTVVKIPPKSCLPSTAKTLPSKKGKTVYRQTLTERLPEKDERFLTCKKRYWCHGVYKGGCDRWCAFAHHVTFSAEFLGWPRTSFWRRFIPLDKNNTVHVRAAWFIDAVVLCTLMLSAGRRILAFNALHFFRATRCDTAFGTSLSGSLRAAGGGRTGCLALTTGFSMPTSTRPPSSFPAQHSSHVFVTTYQVRCLAMFYSLMRISCTVSSFLVIIHLFLWRHRHWHLKTVKICFYRYPLLLLFCFFSNNWCLCTCVVLSA